jgi:hypothetical protein
MSKAMPNRNDRCENCGRSPKPDRTSCWEVATALACASLLLAVFTLTGYALYQWSERQEHGFVDFPFWFEPLDNWSI